MLLIRYVWTYHYLRRGEANGLMKHRAIFGEISSRHQQLEEP